MSLTREQVNEFEAKGFIVVKGFFGPDDMAKLSLWLDELRDKWPAEGKEAKYYETSPLSGENILVRIENVIGEQNREASGLLISDKAREYLTRLLRRGSASFRRQNPTWRLNRSVPGLSVFLLFPGFVRRYDMDTIS